MTTTDVANHSITLRRTFSSKQEDVFRAFKSAEALTQWFSPSQDIPVEIIDFEFKPNGKFRARYTMPDRSQPTVNGVYLKIDAPKELVFSWEWEHPDPHAGIPTIVHILFQEVEGKTEIILTHNKLSTPEARERHGDGWIGTLNRLNATLKTIKHNISE